MLVHIKPHNYNLNSNLKNNKDKNTIVFFLSLFSNVLCFFAFFDQLVIQMRFFISFFGSFNLPSLCKQYLRRVTKRAFQSPWQVSYLLLVSI